MEDKQMKKKIVLHLGVHKTATTSLQTFLSKNRTAIQKSGAMYPPLKEMRANISPLIRSHKKTDRKILRKLLDNSNSSVHLWSDENLVGSTVDFKTGVLYQYAGGRVERLCELFPDWTIEIFICIRSPDRFILSSYSEYIRHKGFESLDNFLENYDVLNFSFLEVFSWIHDLPKNAKVTIVPFEREFGGGIEVILETLLKMSCGPSHRISADNFPKSKSRSSFTSEEIELGSFIASSASPLVAKEFLRMIGSRNLRFGESEFNPLPDYLVQVMRARYSSDLKVLT